MYAIMPRTCAHNARRAGNTNAHAQCTEINILSVTNVHTYVLQVLMKNVHEIRDENKKSLI